MFIKWVGTALSADWMRPSRCTQYRSRDSATPLPNSGRHLLRRESQLLSDLLVRRRRAEAVDPDHQRVMIHVLVPARRAAGLDGHNAAAVRQHRILIVNRLTIEKLERRRGNDASARPLAAQQ